MLFLKLLTLNLYFVAGLLSGLGLLGMLLQGLRKFWLFLSALGILHIEKLVYECRFFLFGGKCLVLLRACPVVCLTIIVEASILICPPAFARLLSKLAGRFLLSVELAFFLEVRIFPFLAHVL